MSPKALIHLFTQTFTTHSHTELAHAVPKKSPVWKGDGEGESSAGRGGDNTATHFKGVFKL